MDKKKSGAKPKYDTPTIMVSFRCPENKVVDFKDRVRAILESYSNLFKGEVSGFVKLEKKSVSKERIKKISNVKVEKVIPMYSDCDCVLIDNKYIKRGKDGCKKSIENHKF